MICRSLSPQLPSLLALDRRGPAIRGTFLLLALLSVWLFTGVRNSLAQPWRVQPHKPHPAVARISAPEQGAISFGSGTLVYVEGDYGLVVTNWHVVRDATGEIGVVFPSGFHSPASVAKVDRDWDLAALVIWRPPSIEPVAISDAPPQPGQPLTIAGYGSGDFRSLRGRCTQYVAPGVNLPFEMVEVSAQARQGDSGGPIFNDRGELAGVLFGAGAGTTSGSYCGRVKRFLASIAPKLDQRVDVSNIAAAPRPRATPRFGTPSFAHTPLYQPPATSDPKYEPIHEPVASLTSPDDQAKRSSSFDTAPTDVPSIGGGVASSPAGAPSGADHGDVVDAAPGSRSAGLSPENAEPSLSPPEKTAVASLSGGDIWQQLAGESPLDQIKTFLAIFGVIALAYHAIRRMRDGDE